MELATITLKLSAQTANTVVKTNVTPAQLSIYAYMHGEDCVQDLKVTSIDMDRQVPKEMDRLRAEFTSDHAQKCLNTLFPGRFPHLPTTFKSIGFDPAELGDGSAPPQTITPFAKNQSEASIMERIREGSPEVKAQAAATKNVPDVTNQDRADALDDTGDDEDEDEIPNDPLDDEINRLAGEEQATPPRKAG